jgi:hypothetical protein
MTSIKDTLRLRGTSEQEIEAWNRFAKEFHEKLICECHGTLDDDDRRVMMISSLKTASDYLTYLLTMPKKEEKRQIFYCLVNCCCCCAKNVVHALAMLVLKSVSVSTVLL